eukprot:scaffold9980_cov121-Isochrysis_galbana.AAC.7
MESLRIVLTRIVGLAVLPAQLPGDAPGLLDDLSTDPVGTIRSWRRSLVWSLLRQIVGCRKLEVPDDSQLRRLLAARARYAQRGWVQCCVRASDGVLLDAMLTPPATGGGTGRDSAVGGRYVLWVGGNFQKYEDWLPYFDIYAREAAVGFLAFNFRGVGLSEGAVLSAADLVLDVAACVRFLQDEHGVTADRLLLHGFSLGGAVAAMYLAHPDAPRCNLISDRSFRSLPHAAHALIRGPIPTYPASPAEPPSTAATAAPTTPTHAPASSPSALPPYPSLASSTGASAFRHPAARLGPACRAWLGWLLPRLVQWCRAFSSALAVAALRALGWDLCAEAAVGSVGGRSVLIFHRRDNVVSHQAASLQAALERRVRGCPTATHIHSAYGSSFHS